MHKYRNIIYRNEHKNESYYTRMVFNYAWLDEKQISYTDVGHTAFQVMDVYFHLNGRVESFYFHVILIYRQMYKER